MVSGRNARSNLWIEESCKETIEEILQINPASKSRQSTYSRREDEVNMQGMSRESHNDMHAVTAPTSSESATEYNFQALSQKIDDAFNMIDRIEQRINPVLMEATPSDSADKAGYPRVTGVSERLGTLCSRMDDLLYRMNSVAGRIDL